MQSEFMYQAAAAGEVDVISAYTSDGRVAQHDLVLLDDPRHAIPPYDTILLVSPRRANDAALIDALRPLLGKIDVALMREANLRAARGGRDGAPEAVAAWLWERIVSSYPD
jgi:osmoprotectant transport system permease protein